VISSGPFSTVYTGRFAGVCSQKMLLLLSVLRFSSGLLTLWPIT
jgi:hypothetical protein